MDILSSLLLYLEGDDDDYSMSYTGVDGLKILFYSTFESDWFVSVWNGDNALNCLLYPYGDLYFSTWRKDWVSLEADE